MSGTAEALAYRLDEAAEALRISTRTLLRRIKDGKIAAKRDGHITLIEREELQRYLRELPSAI